MSGEPLREKTGRAAPGKAAVLLFLAGLVSVAFLAKHNLGLPHSSPSHWITQVCKMREGRRVAAPRAVILQARFTLLQNDQPRPRAAAVPEGDPSQTPFPGFFRRTTLRAPPIV
jgi:hypothetical protein